jgi:hypothetical protein
MKPIERLAFYFKLNNIRFSIVEREVGLANAYLSKQIKNQASIGADILEKICNAYPNINPAWVITGKGEPELNPINPEMIAGRESAQTDMVPVEQVQLYREQIENMAKQIELLRREIKFQDDMIKTLRGRSGEK